MRRDGRSTRVVTFRQGAPVGTERFILLHSFVVLAHKRFSVKQGLVNDQHLLYSPRYTLLFNRPTFNTSGEYDWHIITKRLPLQRNCSSQLHWLLQHG